jgi:hypothetical protein
MPRHALAWLSFDIGYWKMKFGYDTLVKPSLGRLEVYFFGRGSRAGRRAA